MVSVVLNVKNEQEMVRTCLESVKWADEIVIVLNDSTDDTEKIVKEYTKNIYKVEGQDFSKVKNLGFEKTSGNWVLFIDADERVLEPLREEILEIVKSSNKGAYALSRKNIIFGEEVSYGPYKYDWIIRLFKRDKFKGWLGQVHEHGEFEGELGYSKNPLLHLTHRDIDHFILKSLEWSKIDAKLRFEWGHPKMTQWRFFRIFLSELYAQGIKRKGFFSGTIGAIDSILQVFFFYMTYVRLWQLQQKEPLDEKYKKIDADLIKNNFRY